MAEPITPLLKGVKKRPDFGHTQIRTLEQIKAGSIFQMKDSGGERNILVLTNPCQNLEGEWKFRYVTLPVILGSQNIALSAFCSDYGVVQNTEGLWHPSNCLLETAAHRLNTNVLEASIKIYNIKF